MQVPSLKHGCIPPTHPVQNIVYITEWKRSRPQKQFQDQKLGPLNFTHKIKFITWREDKTENEMGANVCGLPLIMMTLHWPCSLDYHLQVVQANCQTLCNVLLHLVVNFCNRKKSERERRIRIYPI